MFKYVNGEYIEITEEEIQEFKNLRKPIDNNTKIERLKQKLTDTDYVVIKIAEGAATMEEYADVIAKRQQWREEINVLEFLI